MLLLELKEKMSYAWNGVSIHYLLDIVITVVMSLLESVTQPRI